MKKIAYLYVCDTMADWETGYITAELHSGRYFRKGAPSYEVKTVGLSSALVTTMGGIKIFPDLSVAEMAETHAGILILPGGDLWLESFHDPLFDRVKAFLDARIPVAAICGATMGLAARGFLDACGHTSNDLGYLKAVCPAYRGESFYLFQPVVTGGNLITASGIAPLDFARGVLEKLDVFSPATLEAWYKLYQTGESAYFFRLMESMSRESNEA
ncbi:MAG TPA: type 1 glutamine amidotransferase family protein [Synergistaceae bacterium]|nr:type 1 glutamine amidotransferase family protein [Synergistaceae bacterium]HPJ26094.1 type 1 glutamine amidotransferase family protein [Synergistaceae bacterium]HPQ36019.1 type 1 glutamine amidotransferase family protein [Synergistaceae bacterium]